MVPILCADRETASFAAKFLFEDRAIEVFSRLWSPQKWLHMAGYGAFHFKNATCTGCSGFIAALNRRVPGYARAAFF